VLFPVKKVSCVTFGGDDLTDMYVTTAGSYDTAANGELAGALFRLNLGVKGRAEFRSRLS
jgi:D-xylonolactonase